MATGLSSGGGVMAPADLPNAGDIEWATHAGIPPTDPIVSGSRGDLPVDVDYAGGARIVTTPEGQAGPATGGAMAAPDMPGLALLDDWRDLFNFRGSPMPWLLLFALVFLGFMSFRVEARARAGSARAGASAALG